MEHIFIHGLGQDASAWDKTLSHMKGLSALCPDLPELLQGREADYETLYRGFSEYCGGLPEPLHLCGLSLGAVLGLNYAIDKPGRVGSLVLIGGQYKMPRLMLLIQNAVLGSMKDSMFAQTGFGKEDFIRLSGSMSRLDFSRDLDKVSCGALVLCGERDKANRKAAEKMAARLPHAELQTVKGSGHEVNVDAPKELAAILRAYYKKTV